MYSKTAILVVTCLASVAFAGPAWYGQDNSSECPPQNKYFYEIGKTYEYDYDAKTRTFIDGTTEDSVDTRIKAKVQIQPISQCEISLTLTEVSLMESAKSDEFASALTKESIRFSMDNGKIMNVFTSETEPVWVTNFKKGIISALQNSMSKLEGSETLTEVDIIGECETNYNILEDKDFNIVVNRVKDPSTCTGNERTTINKLSTFGYSAETFLQEIRIFDGKQNCQQEISKDVVKKVSCSQSFLLRPFSKKEHGAKTEISTVMTLAAITSEIPPLNNRFPHKTSLEFQEVNYDNEASDEKTVVDLLYRLEYTTEHGITKEVPNLFSELVVALRKLNVDQIQRLYEENENFAQKFLNDALMLVGTPASMNVIVDFIKKNNLSAKDTEAWITSLAFIKKPSLDMFSAIQPLFSTKFGDKALLGVSSLVHSYCAKNSECDQKNEITSIIKNFESYLGVGCRSTSDEEKNNIILALKAVGNAGIFVNGNSILRRCYTEDNPMEVRIAAIEAWRRTPSSYNKDHLVEAFKDQTQDSEVRIAAYLSIMTNPSRTFIDTVKDVLSSEGVNQVASFVWTHMSNLQESAFSEKQAIRELIGEEMLQKKFKPEALKFSKNYESSFMLDHLNVGGMAEANVIFSSQSFLPRSAMFNFTVDAFGESINLFEIGGRMEGFESYIEKFFGKDGYYPEETVENILKQLRQQKQEEETTLESYLTKAANDPEGSFYMKVFGNELSYHHFHGLSELIPEFGFKNPMDMIIELARKGSIDYTKSFNVIDSDFAYPTIIGLPLHLKLNGAATLGMKIDGNFVFEGLTSMDIKGALHPSAAIAIDGSMAIDAFVSKSGMKISTSMHSSSHVEGKVIVNGGKVVDIEFNIPKEKEVVFDFTNEIFRIEDDHETKEDLKTISTQKCLDFLTISACYEQESSLPTENSGYFPLSGNFNKQVYLKKTASNTPLKFQFKNEDHMASILLNIPDASTDVGFEMKFNKLKNEFNYNFQHPALGSNYYGKARYHLYGEDKEISFLVGKEQTDLYAAKIHFNQNKEEQLKNLVIELTRPQGNIFKFVSSYKLDKEAGEFYANMELTSIAMPKQSAKFEYSSSRNLLAVDFQLIPFKLDFTSRIVYSGAENDKLFDATGKFQLLGGKSKTFNGFGSYKTTDGNKYSGKLAVEEFGLDSTWNFDYGKNKLDSRIAGVLMGSPFNVDASYSSKQNEFVTNVKSKMLINVPALNVDFVASKVLYFDNNELKSVVDFKFGQIISINKNIHWKFNDSFNYNVEVEFQGQQYTAKVISTNITETRKISVILNFVYYELNGLLKFTTVPDRFSAQLEGQAKIGSQSYSTKWDVNADRSELNLQGSLDCNGNICTVFAKATPTSINISNTFYKPLSIEANMVTVGESKEIKIISSSEDRTFKVEGIFSPTDIRGTMKVDNVDVGISGSLKNGEYSVDVWWTPKDKISMSVSHVSGQKKLTMISLMTPFKGYEKQDLTISYEKNTLETVSQISAHWGNEHHLTITTFRKHNNYGTSRETQIKITSSLDALENILWNTKVSNKTTISIKGIWNEHNMEANFTETILNNAEGKATLKFNSTFTKDLEVNVDFKHYYAGSVVVTYGTDIHHFNFNGNMIDLGNMTGSITLSCPNIVDISLAGKLETGSISKTLQVVGNINEKEILLSLNCETMADMGSTKHNIKADFSVGSFNIYNFKFDHQSLTGNEFKTDFAFTSSYMPEFNTEGHIEGSLTSFSTAVITGYVSGSRLQGRINLNHSIKAKKIFSEFEVSLNSHHLSYEVEGLVGANNLEGKFTGKIDSSVAALNLLNVIVDYTFQNEKKDTSLQISKDSFKMKIDHSMQFKDALNWRNHIKINNEFGMINELKVGSSKVYFNSDMYCNENIIKIGVDCDYRDSHSLNVSLETPWTLPMLMQMKRETTRQGTNLEVAFTYDKSKTLLDGTFIWNYTNKSGKFMLSNENWSFKSLNIEYSAMTMHDVKTFDIMIKNSKSQGLVAKISKDLQKSSLKFEFQGKHEYLIQIEHNGTTKVGTLNINAKIPQISSNLISTELVYKNEERIFNLSGKIMLNNKSYALDVIFTPNEMSLITQCPTTGKTSFNANWNLEGMRTTAFVNFELENKLQRSLDFQYDRNTLKVTYMKDQEQFEFIGKFKPNSLQIQGTTPIQGYETISLTSTFTKSSIQTNLIVEDKKSIFNCEFNLGSKTKGELEMNLQTPYQGFEQNKFIFNYSFGSEKDFINLSLDVESRKLLEFRTHFDRSLGEFALSYVSPWGDVGSTKAIFQNQTVKVFGELNEINFEWIIKSFYDQRRKANVSMSFMSNIQDWKSYSISIDINGSQKPYSASLIIKHEDTEITYSTALNYDLGSFSMEIITPIAGYNTLRSSGVFSHKNDYCKAYFTLTNGDSEINFTGSVSSRADVPEIKVKILTPFPNYENIEFEMEGSFVDQKSLIISSVVGNSEYYANIFFKKSELNGKVGISIRSPFEGFRDISLNSVYNLNSTTKLVKINYQWDNENLRFVSEMNANEIDVLLESSISELKSFRMKGDHSKIFNGYKGHGIISMNDIDYEFVGKTILNDNDVEIEINLPTTDFIVEGFLLPDGVKVTMTKGSGLFAKKYDMKVNYSFAPESAFLTIVTPFEFLSLVDLKFKARNNLVDIAMKLTKNSEMYDVTFNVNVSPMQSNLTASVKIPDFMYNFNAIYDFVSEEKHIELTRDTNNSHFQYKLKALMNNEQGSHGYVKLTTSDPAYSLLGVEYKIQSAFTLKNIDTFMALYKNENTTRFGVKFVVLDDGEIKGIESGFYFGESKAVFEATSKSGEYRLNIEVPLQEFNRAHLLLKHGWENDKKYGAFVMNFNDMEYELNGTLYKSYKNPQLIIKFVTPFIKLPAVEFNVSYDLEKQSFDARIMYNDFEFLVHSKLNVIMRSFLLNAQLKSSFVGWSDTEFSSQIAFNEEQKIFKIVLVTDGNKKEINLSGKFTDNEMEIDAENSFETIPKFKTTGSLNRSKRSLNLGMSAQDHFLKVKKSFKSIKATIHTPFAKAKEVTFELSQKNNGMIEIHYKRNDNFIDFAITPQGKKKAVSITIKSALPGWELLALTGRLDLDEVKAYVSGHINEKKIETTGSGNFSDKTGKMQITMTTPFEKYQTVSINFDYNIKRKIVTFEAKSDSSDFHILLEFKRGITIDIFIPHPEANTVAKGKLTLFNGNLEGKSRFKFLKSLLFNYSIVLAQEIKITLLYKRNEEKKVEINMSITNAKSTVEIHVRMFGNHSMIHYQKEGFKHIELVLHRNDKEFKLVINGSGSLPQKGKLDFTIDNSFRHEPRHVKGSLTIDRTASTKTYVLKVEYPGSKLYVINFTYEGTLQKLRTGSFGINITTPTKDRRMWKNISGNWNYGTNKMLHATLEVGPLKFNVDGKLSITNTDLKILNHVNGETYFVIWTFKRISKGREYYFKGGKEDRYVMFQYHGVYDTIWNGDISGAFRASRFMKNDFKFTDKWTTDATGKLTGSGTFSLGKKQGTSQYEAYVNKKEHAATFHWEATSNIPKYSSMKFDLKYNLVQRMVDFKVSVEDKYISFNTTLDNFGFESSSNKINFHLPNYGDGEITLSHDFSNPLAKSVKAIGQVGGKKISYVANSTRNKALTVYDFNGEVSSVVLGSASLKIGFNIKNLKDATAYLEYKRNNNKFVNMNWHRKRTDTHLENELTLSSHLKFLPTARVHATADWSNGFHLDGGIDWNDSGIVVKADFVPGKVIASITSPFKKANITFNLDYNMKGNEKTATLHYARNSREVHFTFVLKAANKKSGTLDMDLTTPFALLKHVSFNGSWKKGKFSATYKRNDDVTVDFTGEAEVKLEKSAFHVKFTPPNAGLIELTFSYDLQKFVLNKGKKSEKLIDFDLKVAGETVHFTIDGFRNVDKVLIEVNGQTSLDKLSTFYLKVDSELNLIDRIGHFEIRGDEFYYKVTNSFEKRKNGFYARTQIDTSATALPGLIVGVGRDGDSCLLTIGYGDDREITLSIKGKDNFKKGFGGNLSLPRLGINNLKYEVTYGFKGENKIQIDTTIEIGEGKSIHAEIVYNSEGVKGRLTSPFFGNHSVRMRRSISSNHFEADVGVDNYGFTVVGNLLNGKKGFNIEGEIMGKKIKVDAFYDLNGLRNSEGKMNIQTPYFKDIAAFFKIAQINQELHGTATLHFDDKNTMSADMDFDFNNMIQGTCNFTFNKQSYVFTTDLMQEGNSYTGIAKFETPSNNLSIDGKINLNKRLMDVSGSGNFVFNKKEMDVAFSHTILNPEATLTFIVSATDGEKYEVTATYPYFMKSTDFDLTAIKSFNGVQKLYSNIKLNLKSLNEMKVEINVGTTQTIFNMIIDSFKTANNFQGVFSAKLFNLHQIQFRIDLPINSTNEPVEATFVLNSPKTPQINLRTAYIKSMNKISNDFSIKTFKGTYRTIVTITKESKSNFELQAELRLPNTSENFSMTVKQNSQFGSNSLAANGLLMINVPSSKHMLKYNVNLASQTRNMLRTQLILETPLFNLNRFEKNSSITIKNGNYEITNDMEVFGQKHSVYLRGALNNVDLVVIVQSPLLPTGVAKLEVSNNLTSALTGSGRLVLSNKKDTCSIDIDFTLDQTNKKELTLVIRTPFEQREKMNFAIKYQSGDVTFFSFDVSPLKLKAETYFGITEDVFSAGVDIQTDIDSWELTKAQASVPLVKFNPKFAVKVHNKEYALEMQRNRSDYEGDFIVKVNMENTTRELDIDYRLKAPFHFGSIFKQDDKFVVGQSITFDSSFLTFVPIAIFA